MKRKCLIILCGIILLIAIFFPARHARRYNYISQENVYNELVFKPSNEHTQKYCDYTDIILNSIDINMEEIYARKRFEKPIKGGEHEPKHCQALKIALIIPYRNRTRQLEEFINFIHPFLQHQFLSYRIFVISQNDTLPFNRAKMINYGAKVAMGMGFPCLILHDVDLIPLNTGNIYSCTKKPRHMSSSLDKFRFNLPYLTLFGGAVAIQSEHFLRINGMSNEFYGWGGEDDDFYQRLVNHDLIPHRFSPEISKYTMFIHKKEKPNKMRWNKLRNSVSGFSGDGLSSLTEHYTVKKEDLYTVVLAS